MNYDQYLDSLGLTADERKIMDTPARRGAYDAAAAAILAPEVKKRKDYEGQVQTWYTTQVDKMNAKDREVVAARAEEARLKAAFKTAAANGTEGLAEIAKSLNLNLDEPNPAANQPPPSTSQLDPAKFVSMDDFQKLGKTAVDGIALAQDMAVEHRRLFGTDLSFRELQRDYAANGNGMGIENFWQAKYKVAEKRVEIQNAEIKAREDKIREETREQMRTEMLSRGVNPDLAAPSTSNNPLRPAVQRGGVRDGSKQPWEYGDQSAERVQRAVNRWMQHPASHGAAA